MKLLAICLFLVVSIYSQPVLKNNFRLKETNKSFFFNREDKHFKDIKSSEKNLAIAGLLSFIVPGAALGQFYKNEPVNGAIRAGISALCILWFLVSPSGSSHGTWSTQKFFAIGAYTVNWIASIIDAATGRKPEKRKPPRGIYKFGF